MPNTSTFCCSSLAHVADLRHCDAFEGILLASKELEWHLPTDGDVMAMEVFRPFRNDLVAFVQKTTIVAKGLDTVSR